MGYTHHWDIPFSDTWRSAFPLILADVVPIIQASGVRVAIKFHHELESTEIEGFELNGVNSDEHEPFEVWRDGNSTFYKTNLKPCDTVVCVVLLRMKQLMKDGMELSSDGSWAFEWTEARRLYQRLWPSEVFSNCPLRSNDDSEDLAVDDKNETRDEAWMPDRTELSKHKI